MFPTIFVGLLKAQPLYVGMAAVVRAGMTLALVPLMRQVAMAEGQR